MEVSLAVTWQRVRGNLEQILVATSPASSQDDLVTFPNLSIAQFPAYPLPGIRALALNLHISWNFFWITCAAIAAVAATIVISAAIVLLDIEHDGWVDPLLFGDISVLSNHGLVPHRRAGEYPQSAKGRAEAAETLGRVAGGDVGLTADQGHPLLLIVCQDPVIAAPERRRGEEALPDGELGGLLVRKRELRPAQWPRCRRSQLILIVGRVHVAAGVLRDVVYGYVVPRHRPRVRVVEEGIVGADAVQ